MRILFCNYEYPPLGGGGGVLNALLAQELAKKHSVTVLTSQGLDLPAESMEAGVRVKRVPVFFRTQKSVANLGSMLSYVPMGIRAGKQLLSTKQFDVINTHFVLPTGPVGHTLAQFANIPNILSLHGGDLYDPSKFVSPHRHLPLRLMVRHLLEKADIVVGQSSNTIENISRFYTSKVQGLRIPLGIQKPSVSTASRQMYGYDNDEVLLVTVGRLVARKAVDQLIAMMEQFKGQRVRLLIIGSGPEEALLRKETTKRNLDRQICFLGHVKESEKFEILQMSDLYVSTSQHEGFGIVFVEALASGLPVICYDHGGQTDFLEDDQTGYLVPLNDLSSFGKRCSYLIHDSHKRQQLKKLCLQRAEELLITACAERYEQIFQQAIENHRGHRKSLSDRTSYLPRTT